jgi:rRNA processing protein Krr1/Pno1
MDPVERAKQIAQSLSLGGNNGDSHTKRSREDGSFQDESKDPKRPTFGYDKPRYGLGSEERRQKDMEIRSLYNSSNPAPGTVSQEYLIPNHMTGLIIGRGGESLKRIEATTRCKVQIPQDSSEPSRRLTIIGLPEDVERAKQMIKTMIDESDNRPNPKNMGHYGPGAPPHDNNLPPTANQITIPIPRNIVGLIIGRHGDTIRDIAIKSGAKLNVLQNSNTDTNAPISISGEQAAIDKARALIDELISNSQKQNQGVPNNANIVTRHMPVHKDLVGLVIGKKGETIRLLAEQTGCKVFVDQTEIPGTNQKNVNITGPASTIDHCQRLIEERLQASQNPLANATRFNASHDTNFTPNSAQSQIADYYASQGHSVLTPTSGQPLPGYDPYGLYYQGYDINNPYGPGYLNSKQSSKAIAASVSKNPKEYIEYYAAAAKAIKAYADLQDAEAAKKAAAEASATAVAQKVPEKEGVTSTTMATLTPTAATEAHVPTEHPTEMIPPLPSSTAPAPTLEKTK